jgi:hypothetical protein
MAGGAPSIGLKNPRCNCRNLVVGAILLPRLSVPQRLSVPTHPAAAES